MVEQERRAEWLLGQMSVCGAVSIPSLCNLLPHQHTHCISFSTPLITEKLLSFTSSSLGNVVKFDSLKLGHVFLSSVSHTDTFFSVNKWINADGKQWMMLIFGMNSASSHWIEPQQLPIAIVTSCWVNELNLSCEISKEEFRQVKHWQLFIHYNPQLSGL